MYTRPRNSPAKEILRNSFNERAKEGFRYWLIERPKPTKCKSSLVFCRRGGNFHLAVSSTGDGQGFEKALISPDIPQKSYPCPGYLFFE